MYTYMHTSILRMCRYMSLGNPKKRYTFNIADICVPFNSTCIYISVYIYIDACICTCTHTSIWCAYTWVRAFRKNSTHPIADVCVSSSMTYICMYLRVSIYMTEHQFYKCAYTWVRAIRSTRFISRISVYGVALVIVGLFGRILSLL